MNKTLLALVGFIFSACLYAAPPPPPPNIDMMHFGTFSLFKSTQGGNKLNGLENCRGIARAHTPLCPGDNNCEYELSLNFHLDTTTGQANGQGEIHIVTATTFPLTAPADVAKTFQFNAKIDFTTSPFTADFIVQKPGSKGIHFKGLIHLPLPASAVPGCPTDFCYKDITGQVIPIDSDQQVLGYHTTRTYLIEQP